jgi:hypothetical protein
MSGDTRRDQEATPMRPNGESGNAAIGMSNPRVPSRFAQPSLASLLGAVVVFGLPQVAVAQTFDDAISEALNGIQLNFSDTCQINEPGCWITPGSDLAGLLSEGLNPDNNAVAGAVSAAPATVSPGASAAPAIERRLQAVRESEEERREAGLTRVIRASYEGNLVLGANGQLQLPPAGGATPEFVISQARGLSVFASAGATALNHHNNEFEDGYEAQLPTVTVGADYWISPRLLAGGGFNYTNFDGS